MSSICIPKFCNFAGNYYIQVPCEYVHIRQFSTCANIGWQCHILPEVRCPLNILAQIIARTQLWPYRMQNILDMWYAATDRYNSDQDTACLLSNLCRYYFKLFCTLKSSIRWFLLRVVDAHHVQLQPETNMSRSMRHRVFRSV